MVFTGSGFRDEVQGTCSGFREPVGSGFRDEFKVECIGSGIRDEVLRFGV